MVLAESSGLNPYAAQKLAVSASAGSHGNISYGTSSASSCSWTVESTLTRRSVAKRELASIEVGHWNQRSPARVTPDVVLLTWRLDPVANQPTLGAADNAVDFVLPRSTRRQVL